MKIDNRILLSTEEAEIMDIYNKVKIHFPNIKIKEKNDYLGVGMDGHQLLCYFTVRENTIFVKRKSEKYKNIYMHALQSAKRKETEPETNVRQSPA